MKTLSVKLPTPLASWLTERSKKLGRTQSDLVREALERDMEGNKDKSTKSCADLMTDLGGFFEGPTDLSSNPKYLESFGK